MRGCRLVAILALVLLTLDLTSAQKDKDKDKDDDDSEAIVIEDVEDTKEDAGDDDEEQIVVEIEYQQPETTEQREIFRYAPRYVNVFKPRHWSGPRFQKRIAKRVQEIIYSRHPQYRQINVVPQIRFTRPFHHAPRSRFITVPARVFQGHHGQRRVFKFGGHGGGFRRRH